MKEELVFDATLVRTRIFVNAVLGVRREKIKTQHMRKHMSRSSDRKLLTRKIIQLFPLKSTTPVRDNELRNMGCNDCQKNGHA